MKILVRFLMVFAIFLLGAPIASALTMEFDNPVTSGFTDYTEDGINLSISGASEALIFTSPADNYLHVDGGSITFRKTDNTRFNLSQFEVIPMMTSSSGAFLQAGSFSLTLTSGLNDFSSYSELQNIDSFTINVNGESIYMDCFQIDSVTLGGAAPVPEPTTMVLFGLGSFGLLAGVLRKKIKTA